MVVEQITALKESERYTYRRVWFLLALEEVAPSHVALPNLNTTASVTKLKEIEIELR